MVNKFEAYGIALSIGFMALALWLIRVETTENKLATLEEQRAAVYVADESGETQSAVADAYVAATSGGSLEKLIIDDVVVGTGPEVSEGDKITVNYIGTLQTGEQFDSSYDRGLPFSFTVGDGRVIAGWEEGVLGMQAGGQRILVIPYDKAYGESGFGPIPPRADLVFAIELLAINEQ